MIYQVVGGTWANGSTEIEQVYHLSEYDETSDKWVEVSPAPTLTNIPDTTKVEPDAAHILSGAWDDESPVAGAALTAGTSTTYTYRLTAAAPAMTVEKTAQEASVRVGEQMPGVPDTYLCQVFPDGHPGLFLKKLPEIFGRQPGMGGQQRKGNILRIIFLDIVYGFADGFFMEQTRRRFPGGR